MLPMLPMLPMLAVLPRQFHRALLAAVAGTILCATVAMTAAAQTAGATFDATIAPGANYDKADFRLWYPGGVSAVRGVAVLVPGSNGDGRSMAADTVWQQFAARNQLALVACHLTDKPHDEGFIEQYADVSHGSGQALLDALRALGTQSGHAELANAPLLLWGMSAGGEFDYEFAAWQPARVIAFVVNKGGIYYSALTSRETRQVPALLFIGGKDLESRIDIITGLFAVNRRGGALWALTEEPGAAHVVGRSRDLSIRFFDDLLPLRLPPGPARADGPTMLLPIAEHSGFIADLTLHTYQPAPERASAGLTAWLPTERTARAWQAVVADHPFDP
jgi:poly(3-hydroxybutyrate) depolymerase